ncbi:MAG: hypothetical protein JW852_00580 [Spirochaetales bacterium]|nr:hypothetical protein [Spirochaetales bacterium]
MRPGFSKRAWHMFVFAVLLFGIPAGMYALDTDPVLTGDFWVELDPFVETEGGAQQTDEEAYTRILEEARYVFSGMIYGYTFLYTPSDATRKVDELFTFDPVAQIPWGDPGLSIAETWTEGNLLHAYVRYFPKDHQLRWLRMMQSNIYHNATGRGRASMFAGASGKYEAVAEAAKEAIRAHLRPRIFNKPKEVRGSVVLAEAPYIVIDAGEYEAKVTVRIDVGEIIPYRLY